MTKHALLGVIVTIAATTCFSQQYGSFKDPRDGRVYKTVKIGSQEWMAENLNTTKFSDGSPIPKNMWKWYNNDKRNGEQYGALYTWYSIKDKRNIAPKGWHIPSPQEWEDLFKYLGGNEFDREEKLKRIGWSPKRAGFFYSERQGFFLKGEEGRWWIGGEHNNEEDTVSVLIFQDGEGGTDYSDFAKGNFYSVRCIKD
ncbi:MAG: FISUMP domain-containing protein [Bacteroidota bacterium]